MKWILAGVAAIFFLGQSNRGLWLPDEPRDAEIAREMAVSGDFVVPTLNGEPFLEKPPLSYATAATALRIWPGRPETAVRIPSALFCLGTMACTAWMGWRLMGLETGLLAAALLGTSWEFLQIGHTCLVDAGLLCWTALAMAAGLDRKWLLSGFAMGLAFLSKGPIGIILPGAALGSWMLWERRGEIPKALGWTVLGILPAGLWLWALHQRGTAWDAYWGDQFRRTGSRVEHAAPFHAYLGYLFEGFAPWCVLLPFLAWKLWKLRMSGIPLSLRLPLSWFLLSLILLSLVSSKRGLYLVPAYPALALMLAAVFQGAWMRRALVVVVLVCALVWGGWKPRQDARYNLGAVVMEAPLAGMGLSEPVRGAVAFRLGRTIPTLKDTAAVADWISRGNTALIQSQVGGTPEGLEAGLRKDRALAAGFEILQRENIRREVLVWVAKRRVP